MTTPTINITFNLQTPYVTLKKYAEMTGLSVSTIRNMRNQGELPIKQKTDKKGAVLVNLLAIAKDAAAQA